jgi:sugar fermentation stimulation protein A
VGLYYRDRVAPLFSSRANKAAEALILPEIIPGLREIRREFTLGTSRFDFLCIDRRGMRRLVEVKACSLIEEDTAMFPDAPSGRALKHLEELAVLGNEGFISHILFVIVHGSPRVFIPNLHTDPDFAAALSRYGRAVKPPEAGKGCSPEASGKSPARRTSPGFSGAPPPVFIHAALLRCDREGNAVLANPAVPVDLSYGELAESDRGSYLIILELPEARQVEPGSLGTLTFAPGWYVYAGSAQKNLSRRVNRHLRKIRKQKHWHIDYLTPFAKTLKALPVMSRRNLECRLARALGELGGQAVPGFGSSDCRCGSHLYYFTAPPMKNPAFVDMLLQFRHRL